MFIRVTRVSRELNDEASKKLEKFEDEVSFRFKEDLKDEHGNTKEWYETMDIPVPDELLSKSKNEDYIEFDLDKDYNIVKRSSLINLNKIMDIDDTEGEESFLGNSILSLGKDYKILVEENIEQIQKLINNNDI